MKTISNIDHENMLVILNMTHRNFGYMVTKNISGTVNITFTDERDCHVFKTIYNECFNTIL